MSHYDCILPVDFERLSREVMPAWLEFIAGKRDPRLFADEFAPWQVGVADLQDWDDWLEPFDLSPSYLKWFCNREMMEWKADSLRADFGDSLKSESWPWCGSNWLALVIKQSCAVEISGVNPFQEHSLLNPFNSWRFFGRLHDPPFVQVVGAKNRFRFLDELYRFDWDDSRHYYSISRKGTVSEDSYFLLDNLLLWARAFPGTNLLSQPMVWSGSDDDMPMGFLTPEETRKLATRIPEIEAVVADIDHKSYTFDLFADRVIRSADCGAGLVALLGGL